MTQQTLEKGTAIFNARGQTAEVALDRRAKGGRLWGKSSHTRRDYRTRTEKEVRYELHGLWLAGEGNEPLAHFCIRTQRAAITPLREQVEALNRRIGQIRDFTDLTMLAVAGGTVSDEVVARIALDVKYADSTQRREICNRLGSPKEGMYYATYEARLKKNVGGPVIVFGDKGEIEIAPPVELLKEVS